MTQWELFTTRSFVKDKEFYSTQIEDGLDVGLYPTIILFPDYNQMPKVIDNLCNYIQNKERKGEDFKITAHVNAGIIDFKSRQITESNEIKACINFIHKVNKKLGYTAIKEADVHAGSLHSFDDERRIRKTKSFKNIDATFTAEEYLTALEKTKDKVSHLRKYAQQKNINLLIENVSCINYALIHLWDVLEKDYNIKDYLRNDKRHSQTPWIPSRIQKGDIGYWKDLAYITDGDFCIDIEHLDQTVEYSKEFNFNMKGKRKPETMAQRKLLNIMGVWVKHGEPVLFEEEIDSSEFIENLDGRIKQSHLVGQVSMFYYDNGIKKIGSHTPILFEDDEDPLKIVENDEKRREMGRKRREKIKKDLKALNNAGCRRGVFEIFLGSDIHSGNLWKYYNEVSRKNVESVLNTL